MGLKEYKLKRKFKDTPEPKGRVKKENKALRFVVQKHDASHLHYDFRLEMEGVLKSWAIPKGPSMNPSDKRLAIMVEDHPKEYGTFEGIIPKGNYGAGTVMVWDEGNYKPVDEGGEKSLRKGLHEGNLKFILSGKKLKGEFALVRLKSGKGNEWLLIKKNDKYSIDKDIVEKDKSVATNRSLDEIREQSGQGSTVWHSKKEELNDELIKDAVKAKMPHGIKPMMATLIDESFDSADWIYEIKWDGYRAIAEVNYNEVSIYSRNNISFNKDFSAIVESLSSFGAKAILDGEICVVDNDGKSSFQLIQNYKNTGKGNVFYYVFDILYYNGYDLRDLPLLERKKILKNILPDLHNIRYSDHIKNDGLSFFEVVKEQGLEGIIAKKANSKYAPGIRGKDWLKIKVQHEQEAVIAGYTKPRGGRKYFGALVLGVYDGDDLIYIGHSGGGFSDESLKEMYSRFKPLVVKESYFKETPKTNMPVTWVKPELVCVVKFQEWTNDGLMRQPIFMGIREDKKAKEVNREIKVQLKKALKAERTIIAEPKNRKPIAKRSNTLLKKESKSISGSKLINKRNLNEDATEALVKVNKQIIKLTNLKKIFWPEEGYTKRDVIEYYDVISPYILSYLKDRPESLRRNPNGYNKQSFFQKDMPPSTPDWIETLSIYSESNDKDIQYMICQDKATLLYMANLGCIEINPWLSRKQKLDNPDYIVIDLDPQDVPFEQVIEVAQVIKEILDKGKINGFCKTSGSRGMHIYIPMGAKYNYEQAKDFAQLIAILTHNIIPEITSLERMPNKRKNKTYLDYLQNRKGQTLAAPYCVRPKPGATVSTPLEWKEVKEGLHPSQFNIKNIIQRVEEKGDIFKGVMGKGIDMEKAVERLSNL